MTTLPDISWCKKGGSRGWVTTRPVIWRIGKKDSEWKLEIPAGREFESSVPWYLMWAQNPDDPYFLLSACVHDVLLETGNKTDFADSQWLEAAMKVGAERRRRNIISFFMKIRRIKQRSSAAKKLT